MKAPDTVVGPHDDVLVPRGARKTDWEVELAVVIGRDAPATSTDAADALACIAGYAISHDVSEREFQLERGGQWDKGKYCETFNPLGPWLVTADEVPDPQALGLRCGSTASSQDGTTADRSSASRVVWYLSQFMVLDPGDVINTGTPAGVALGCPATPTCAPGTDSTRPSTPHLAWFVDLDRCLAREHQASAGRQLRGGPRGVAPRNGGGQGVPGVLRCLGDLRLHRRPPTRAADRAHGDRLGRSAPASWSRTRARGVAFESEESDIGIAGIGAVGRRQILGEPVGAYAAAMPVARFDHAIESVSTAMSKAGDDASRALGYRGEYPPKDGHSRHRSTSKPHVSR